MEKVKITSGKYRGREITTPGAGTHPMGAREKLALFNMIAENLPNATVLDAYAGSGALGIEALSRGAKEVIFVEKNTQAAKVIRQNLVTLGLDGEIITGDILNFHTDAKFDVILADPPYDKFEVAGVEHLLQFLNNGGILVLSHPDGAPKLPGVELLKTRKYAAAHLSVYAKL